MLSIHSAVQYVIFTTPLGQPKILPTDIVHFLKKKEKKLYTTFGNKLIEP